MWNSKFKKALKKEYLSYKQWCRLLKVIGFAPYLTREAYNDEVTECREATKRLHNIVLDKFAKL